MSNRSYNQSRQEFLVDNAAYFADKKELYLQIKDEISVELGIPLSMIRICGSAYWGQSFTTSEAFTPGDSDLDVALVSADLYVQCLSEVRQITFNFSNLTSFNGSQETPLTFQEYAYKKGIIRVDMMPRTRTKMRLDNTSRTVSRNHSRHFSKITFSIYDTESSFAVKQISSVSKFRSKR